MLIHRKTHPVLFAKWGRELSSAEHGEGFEVDAAAYARFRREADLTMRTLTPEERDAWAAHVAKTHPGFHGDGVPKSKESLPAPISFVMPAPAPAAPDKSHSDRLLLIIVLLLGAIFALAFFAARAKAEPQPDALNVIRHSFGLPAAQGGISGPGAFKFDASNYLYVDCPGCSGVTGFSDNSAFTVGTTPITLLGAYYTTGSAPTISSGNAGRLRMDASSYLYTDCVVGCSGGATTPADAFANPTTAGLSFDLLAGFNGTTWDRLRDDSNKYLFVDVANSSLAVTGTFWQTTQPTSCTSANCSVNLGQFGGSNVTIGQQLAAASLPVILPSATVTTLTPPTAAAIGTSVSTDLLLGTQVAGSSVPVALPTATITTLTPPTAAAVGTSVSTDLLLGTQLAAASVPVALPTATITALTPPTTVAVTQGTAANLNATVVGSGVFEVGPTTGANTKTNPFFAATTDGANVITAALSALGVAPTGTEVEMVNNDNFIGGTVQANDGTAGYAGVGGHFADNGAAAATNRVPTADGIYQNTYANGTAPTQGRNAAPEIGTDGLLWTANLPSYRPASFSGSSQFAGSSTTDNAVLTGNATTDILVTRLKVSCTQTTAGNILLKIFKRTTADTSGTSASVTPTPDDSNYSADATMLTYTGTGPSTTGTALVDSYYLGCNAPATAGPNDIYILNRTQKPIVLIGTAQQLAVNFGGAITGGNLTVTYEWIEVTHIAP